MGALLSGVQCKLVPVAYVSVLLLRCMYIVSCPITVNINSIELNMHTFCYFVKYSVIRYITLITLLPPYSIFCRNRNSETYQKLFELSWSLGNKINLPSHGMEFQLTKFCLKKLSESLSWAH